MIFSWGTDAMFLDDVSVLDFMFSCVARPTGKFSTVYFCFYMYVYTVPLTEIISPGIFSNLQDHLSKY